MAKGSTQKNRQSEATAPPTTLRPMREATSKDAHSPKPTPSRTNSEQVATTDGAESCADVVLRSPTELSQYHKALVDGHPKRGEAVRSFKCTWPASATLSAIELIHLACILCKLTGLTHLHIPVRCSPTSLIEYDYNPWSRSAPTLLPTSLFLDLFETMGPMSNLRVLDVTLDILVRLPEKILEHVACLSLRIAQHEQPVACSAISWLFGRNLRSLRIIRECFGQLQQESPARVCALLDAPCLTYFELRDVDLMGTSVAPSIDELEDLESDDAFHNVPMLTTIVWEPSWSSRQAKADPSYWDIVCDRLWDLIFPFGQGLVFLREDHGSAHLLGSGGELGIPVTSTRVDDSWWEIDSWGESWTVLLWEVIMMHDDPRVRQRYL
ncbi:hypothetical protein L227DRAFT_653143 [Lentinus tigrinus ALCF2SS1-6]|uniref:Uncharacterized protein n=1 Tax=Lentinus tigrinus ALCF2SS1-6 TaxID=1328759 RepID=A0A5C2SC88_9APHY|nr:hypothetical protein L227DRAFT_653143 [Lentinus tigrinus ALCF2SS1-6]